MTLWPRGNRRAPGTSIWVSSVLFFTCIVLKLKQCENIARDIVPPGKQKEKKNASIKKRKEKQQQQICIHVDNP